MDTYAFSPVPEVDTHAIPPVSGADTRQLREVAAVLSELQDRLSAASVGSLAQSVVDATVELLPAARWCSISVQENGRFRTLVATDEFALTIDALQYEVGTGPCIDAALDDTLNVSQDLRTETRWAEYARRASQAGVRSVVAYQLNLLVEGQAAGLNLYSDLPDAFDEETVWMGRLLATHASLGVSLALARRKAENLEMALRSNREIGTAMGVLMGLHRVTRDQAFDLLRLASQHTNRKVASIADDVITSGRVPLPRKPTEGNHFPPGVWQDEAAEQR